MKKKSLWALLIFALGLPLAAQEGTKVTIDISGLMWTRGAGTAVPLLSLYSNPGMGDVLTTDGVALNSFKLGGDLKLGAKWGRLGAEIRGFMLGKWSNSSVFTTTAGTSLAVETNPITSYYLPGSGAAMTTTNESSLKGFEANLTYDLSPAVCLYGGARYLLIDETLDMYGNWGSGHEDDVWNTTNRMLGAQVGIRFDFLPQAEAAAQGFTLRGHGAVALFTNSGHVDFTVVDSSKASVADASNITPGVDAGLQFGYRIGGSFELYAGYDFLWLSAVAQATAQVAGTTSFNSAPTSVIATSSLLVHGAKVGLVLHF